MFLVLRFRLAQLLVPVVADALDLEALVPEHPVTVAHHAQALVDDGHLRTELASEGFPESSLESVVAGVADVEDTAQAGVGGLLFIHAHHRVGDEPVTLFDGELGGVDACMPHSAFARLQVQSEEVPVERLRDAVRKARSHGRWLPAGEVGLQVPRGCVEVPSDLVGAPTRLVPVEEDEQGLIKAGDVRLCRGQRCHLVHDTRDVGLVGQAADGDNLDKAGDVSFLQESVEGFDPAVLFDDSSFEEVVLEVSVQVAPDHPPHVGVHDLKESALARVFLPQEARLPGLRLDPSTHRRVDGFRVVVQQVAL